MGLSLSSFSMTGKAPKMAVHPCTAEVGQTELASVKWKQR